MYTEWELLFANSIRGICTVDSSPEAPSTTINVAVRVDALELASFLEKA